MGNWKCKYTKKLFFFICNIYFVDQPKKQKSPFKLIWCISEKKMASKNKGGKNVYVCVGVCMKRERERKGGRRKIKNGDTNRKTDKSWFFALKSILNDGTYFVNLIECIWTRFLSWFSLQQGFFSFLGFVNCWLVIWFMSNQGQHVKKWIYLW